MKLDLVYCHTCMIAHAPGDHEFLKRRIPAEKPGEPQKTGGASEGDETLRGRLAETERKLAEMVEKRRTKERSKKARLRANQRARQQQTR